MNTMATDADNGAVAGTAGSPGLAPAWRARWLEPFLGHLAGERRNSRYTVRNYEQAVGIGGRGRRRRSCWAATRRSGGRTGAWCGIL